MKLFLIIKKEGILKTALRMIMTSAVAAVVFLFFFYPAWYCLSTAADKGLKKGEIPSRSLQWFRSISSRYERWAECFVSSQYAASVDVRDVAQTEWPMFGSVFYLASAEEIAGRLRGREDAEAKETLAVMERAAKAAIGIVVDPDTATWVKKKWGKDYLIREDLFYRVLLIMGITSFENVTGDRKYRDILREQTVSLANELSASPSVMLDDYPGECYPNDNVWGVAAIIRADRLLGTDHSVLKKKIMGMLDTALLTKEGLPAYQADSRTVTPYGPARGCANSGILVYAPELDFGISEKWYSLHEKLFWKDTGFMAGFCELKRGSEEKWEDVDSGPVVLELGTAASAFGIGAARAMGRFDHSVPVTLEAVACSWPTPFGFLVPGLMGYLATDAPVLGELALFFSMTRPVLGKDVTCYSGLGPGIFWALCAFYVVLGFFFLFAEFRYWKKLAGRLSN